MASRNNLWQDHFADSLYVESQLRPLAEVKAAVRDRVAAEQAAALARKEGEARLAELRKAPDTALSVPTLTVSRAQLHELPRAVVDGALRTGADKLPAIDGVDLGAQGFAVIKLLKVLGRDPAAADPARVQAQYAQAWADAESQAYYSALKSRFRVETTASAANAASAATN